MPKALLVGNGINNVEAKAYRWGDLVRDLVDYAARESGRRMVRRIRQTADKPFTLLYEELVAVACCDDGIDESSIKQFIAEQSVLLHPNEIYGQIAQLAPDHLLTTNYEGLLVDAVGGDYATAPNEGVLHEKMYSLFRHRRVGETSVWHVHGEAQTPRSINLGYEHYAGQLQRMRNYVVTETNYDSLRLEAWIRRARHGTPELLSWIDLFFTHEVHIVGLTLDFVEMDLWWLITYRNRLLASPKTRPLLAGSRVVYYIPKRYEASSAAKLQLLRSLGVQVMVKSDGKDDLSYYRRVLDSIK